jgi:hypothetical protein
MGVLEKVERAERFLGDLKGSKSAKTQKKNYTKLTREFVSNPLTPSVVNCNDYRTPHDPWNSLLC